MSDFDFIPFDGRQDLIEFTDGNTGESVYWGADGDEYYNAKGEKLKGFLQKFKKGGGFWQKGFGKGLSKIAQAVVKVERKLLGKSKEKDKGTKEEKKADRDKRRQGRKEQRELKRQQKSDGTTVYQEPLPPADANTPADKIVDIEGQKLSTVGVPANVPIVVANDPTTGTKSVGVELKPEDVTAVQGQDGLYSYYRNDGGGNTSDGNKGMSTTTKIALGVGGAVVLGLIIYLVVKKK